MSFHTPIVFLAQIEPEKMLDENSPFSDRLGKNGPKWPPKADPRETSQDKPLTSLQSIPQGFRKQQKSSRKAVEQ